MYKFCCVPRYVSKWLYCYNSKKWVLVLNLARCHKTKLATKFSSRRGPEPRQRLSSILSCCSTPAPIEFQYENDDYWAWTVDFTAKIFQYKIHLMKNISLNIISGLTRSGGTVKLAPVPYCWLIRLPWLDLPDPTPGEEQCSLSPPLMWVLRIIFSINWVVFVWVMINHVYLAGLPLQR